MCRDNVLRLSYAFMFHDRLFCVSFLLGWSYNSFNTQFLIKFPDDSLLLSGLLNSWEFVHILGFKRTPTHVYFPCLTTYWIESRVFQPIIYNLLENSDCLGVGRPWFDSRQILLCIATSGSVLSLPASSSVGDHFPRVKAAGKRLRMHGIKPPLPPIPGALTQLFLS